MSSNYLYLNSKYYFSISISFDWYELSMPCMPIQNSTKITVVNVRVIPYGLNLQAGA